jgi:hypothetical protein
VVQKAKAAQWFADERNATQRYLIREQQPVPKYISKTDFNDEYTLTKE